MKIKHNIRILLLSLFVAFTNSTIAQTPITPEERQKLSEQFDKGKVQFGVGLCIKADLISNTFGYYRISLIGGAGIPFGKELGLVRNSMTGFYFMEFDFFRGGLGTPALALDNQKLFIEMRQSFLFSVGRMYPDAVYNYNRPVIQFVSNSAHPLYDPYNCSFTIGSTFINGLNVKRSQRIGIVNFGYEIFQFAYMNDGPPFIVLPFGDGFDRFWTGSGQVGIYWPDYRYKWFRNLELKYDKFTGLQPYAYELSTALRLKHIPYKSKVTQLYNRQRYEISLGTNRGIGYSMNLYDAQLIDVQHLIHNNRYSYHNTPLKWRLGSGLLYNNTFIIN